MRSDPLTWSYLSISGKKNWVPISPAELQASVDQAAERTRKSNPKTKSDATSAPRVNAKGKKSTGSAPGATAASKKIGKKGEKKEGGAPKAPAELSNVESSIETAPVEVSTQVQSSLLKESGNATTAPVEGAHVESGPDGMRKDATTFSSADKPAASATQKPAGGRGAGKNSRGRGPAHGRHPGHHHIDPAHGSYLQSSSAIPMPAGAFPPLHHVPGVGSFPIGGFIPPTPPVLPTRANGDVSKDHYTPPLPLPVTLPNFPLDSLRFYLLGQVCRVSGSRFARLSRCSLC